jgi:histidinol dehydrogenase
MRDRILRFTGAYEMLSEEERKAFFLRAESDASTEDVSTTVGKIIARVKRDGDAALVEMARELDHAELASVEVPRARWKTAFDNLTPALRGAMRRSAGNIEAFHRSQLPSVSSIIIEPGVILRRRPDPLGRVGVYAPGGRAAYPSSVLMGVIPARTAGVSEVILCSPPGPSGIPEDSILAAAYLANADRVFAIGGAGAIAAMSIGTATIPRVDKVVGPGNAYVAEAKLQLASFAAFDSPAGPSELLVIADDSSNPQVIVREMLAQAEHDPKAAVILLAIGDSLAAVVEKSLARHINETARENIVRQSLRARGAALSVRTREEAVTISNQFAPEHLMLATSNPEPLLASARNAGTVFLGESSSVAFGDYMTGANHVLPTGGLARSYSGLSTSDFIRWTSVQTVTPAAAALLASDVAEFANAEGLHAHASAALQWKGECNDRGI